VRGEDLQSEGFFSYLRLEQRVPAIHPLRAIRELVDAALKELSRDFNKLYARDGRPSPGCKIGATTTTVRQAGNRAGVGAIACPSGYSGAASAPRSVSFDIMAADAARLLIQ
jgi:hypothetical protein